MNGIKLFNDLMEYADGKGASDVHLVPGRTAMLRIDGELTAAGQEDAAEWQDADLTEVTEQILSGDQLEEYRTKGALVCSYSFSKALRLRVSVYRQQGRDAMSVRLHPAGVPMPEKLLLPEEITEPRSTTWHVPQAAPTAGEMAGTWGIVWLPACAMHLLQTEDASPCSRSCSPTSVFLTVPTARTTATPTSPAPPLPRMRSVRSPWNSTGAIISRVCS